MQTPVPRFSTSVAYWPRRTGVHMWSHGKRDDLRRDFEPAASYGLQLLDVTLVWPEFQPEAQRIAAAPMRHLEELLDVAREYGIQLSLSMVSPLLGRLLTLPSWALETLMLGDREVWTGSGFSRMQPRDPFGDERFVASQAMFAREVAREFGGHPSVARWILGDGIDVVKRPDSTDRLSEWVNRMLDGFPGRRETVWIALSAGTVVRVGVPDPSAAAGIGGLAIATGWQPPWAHGAGSLWPAFLGGYGKTLSRRDVLLRFPAEWTSGEGERQARWLEGAVSGGARGALGPPLIDAGDDAAATPPYRRGAGALARGLFDARAAPRPSAEVWREASAAPEPVHAVPGDFPTPDPELQRRRPEETAFECFEAMVR